MGDLFRELLDEGWIVAGFRRPIVPSVIKKRLIRYLEKGHIIKCHSDENNIFRIAHREKDLRDYFGSKN